MARSNRAFFLPLGLLFKRRAPSGSGLAREWVCATLNPSRASPLPLGALRLNNNPRGKKKARLLLAIGPLLAYSQISGRPLLY